MAAVPVIMAAVPVSIGAVPFVIGAVPPSIGVVPPKIGVVPLETGVTPEICDPSVPLATGAGPLTAAAVGPGEATGITCVTGSVPCPQDAAHGRAASTANAQNRMNIPPERFIDV